MRVLISQLSEAADQLEQSLVSGLPQNKLLSRPILTRFVFHESNTDAVFVYTHILFIRSLLVTYYYYCTFQRRQEIFITDEHTVQLVLSCVV